jgi:hypothetical protein
LIESKKRLTLVSTRLAGERFSAAGLFHVPSKQIAIRFTGKGAQQERCRRIAPDPPRACVAVVCPNERLSARLDSRRAPSRDASRAPRHMLQAPHEREHDLPER